MEARTLNKSIIRVDTLDNVGAFESAPLLERKKINPNVLVVSKEEIDELKINDTNHLLPYNIDYGSILVKHPYIPQKYILIEELEDTLHTELQKCLFAVAQLLGATKAEWYKEVVDKGIRRKENNGNISIAPISTDFHGSYHSNTNELGQKHESYIQLWKQTGEFSDEKRRRGYKKALKIVHEFHLDDNQGIKNLLDGRNPEYDNISTSLEVCISITNDINKSYDYAFSLNVMDDIFKIDAHIASTIEKHRKVELRYKIYFEEYEE